MYESDTDNSAAAWAKETVPGSDATSVNTTAQGTITSQGEDEPRDVRRQSLTSQSGLEYEDDGGDAEALERTRSTRSIAETLPWYRELLFVAVICLAQLFTQAGLGQILSIIHIVGATWGLAESPDLSWLMAGYSLTVGTFILFSGRLGDTFGYKTIFLIGMAWFSLWSMICGLAVYSSHVLFVFSRVFQGIGPALVLPNGLALLGATYAPGKKKSLAFAAFAATAPAGSIIGATFSGLFALTWWPWTFWCFSLVLAGTVVLGYLVIPPVPASKRESRPRSLRDLYTHLDVLGALVGVLGLVLFNFAWNQAPIVGWQEPYVGVTLVMGLIFIALYLLIEIRYAARPLVPFDALTSDVAFVLAAVACGWGCFGIWLWYTWQIILELRGASPLLACAQFVPVIVFGALAAAGVGLLLHRVGPPRVMLGALVAFTVGTILMATSPVSQTYWTQTFLSFIIMPWGMDMSFPAATLILSNAVAREHQGIAASLVNTVVNYSIAFGLGIAGTVEYQTNKGGKTVEELLRGYRAAYYLAIGIAGLGIGVCIVFLFKSRKEKARGAQGEKNAN